MRWKPLLVVALLFTLPAVSRAAATNPTLRLSEIVADPQQDWTGDGKVTSSDEYVEIWNPTGDAVPLAGWRLWMNDTTPTWGTLSGSVPASGYLAIQNPPGDINNNGHVALFDASGALVDEVRFGSWTGTAPLAPTADAHDVFDESLRRLNGTWALGHATPGASNDAVQMRLGDAFVRRGAAGWVGPNLTAPVWATMVHSTLQFTQLRLWDLDGPSPRLVGSSTAAPSHRMTGNWTLGTGLAPMAYQWEVVGSSGSIGSTNVAVNVDGQPPIVAAQPTAVWVSASSPDWTPPDAQDPGIGGIEYQWRGRPPGSSADATTNWATNPTVNLSALGAPSSVTGAMRARDALNNTSPWTSDVLFSIDDAPPSVVANLTVSGDGPFRVAWGAAIDTGSGLQRYDLQRRVGGTWETVALPPEATNWTSQESPEGGNLSFAVRGVDAVGNVGPWSVVEADYEARHPALRGVRITKAIWGPGVQELRFDFDRPMDPARPPALQWSGLNGAPPGGRYFSNRSTYFVSLNDSARFQDGIQTVRLVDAWSADGVDAAPVSAAAFRVDHTRPRIVASVGNGWTNAREVRLVLEDGDPEPASLSWTLTAPAAEEAWQDATFDRSAVVPIDGSDAWTIAAHAVDAAGNAAPTLRLSVRVDTSAPSIGPPERSNTSSGPAFALAVADLESGVNWSSLHVDAPLGAGATPDASHHRFLVRGTPGDGATLAGSVRDNAGNEARFLWSLPRMPTPPKRIQPPAKTHTDQDNSTVLSLARRVSQAQPVASPTRAGATSWAPWVAGIAGALGLAVPVARRQRSRKRRPRAPKPSFANRLRAARALPP